jgi:hypothetical protein
MATLQQNLSNAFLRLVTAINNVNTNVGTLSNLSTKDQTSLVAALNEVKNLIPTSYATIDDTSTANSTTWSSNKIQTQITNAITALINGADSASDTLKELADQIVAIAQTENGLLSFAASQKLTADQMTQGCTNLGIGEPNTNFVTDIEKNLNSGL